MKVEELRIGNLFENSYQSYSTVTQLSTKVYDEEYACHNIDGCKPIPLTEEWLVKLGFKKDSLSFTGEIGYAKRGHNYYVGISDNGFNEYMFHNPHFNLIIKHVHQLQNLYYALTGEELKIEESPSPPDNDLTN